MTTPTRHDTTEVSLSSAPEVRIRRSRVQLAAALFGDASRRNSGFPRSATFRLLSDHRLLFVTGVAATLLMRGAPVLGRRLLAVAAALRLLQERTGRRAFDRRAGITGLSFESATRSPTKETHHDN